MRTKISLPSYVNNCVLYIGYFDNSYSSLHNSLYFNESLLPENPHGPSV